jgi:hypothetical protein
LRKHDKNVHDTICYTVYNCPNTETYRVNKIHIGLGCLARYEFYWPDIFRIRTIVHCITNLSWFCNQTSYLMFSILGQWIYHDFESIQPCISCFSFPWDMEFVMALSPYFTSDSIFFVLSQRCKGDNSNWLNKILHWNLLGQYQLTILRDLT